MRGVSGAALMVAFLSALISGGQAWGQVRKVIRLGVLTFDATRTADAFRSPNELPLRRVLARQGWTEQKDFLLEVRNSHGNPPRFDEVAAELVRLNVDVLCADSAPATRAAYAATKAIPIVALDFTNDPVAAGYVESYARPGGNLTGVFLDAPGFAAKWLELLSAIVPNLSRVGVVWDPSPGAAHLEALRAAAPTFGVTLQVVEVRKPDDFAGAFAALGKRTQALVILPSPMTWAHSAELAQLAMSYRLVAASMAPEFSASGGALTYGPDLASALERLAIMVAKVMGGVKPADLPVDRPAKFNLIVNARTLKSLGLAVPQAISVAADEVIR
jgi:ABC-type uncharacterized transport system substrate-binding protein